LLAALHRLSGLSKPDLRTRLAISDLLQQTGRNSDAIARLRSELRRNQQVEPPDRAFAYLVLGAATFSLAQISEALTAFRQAIQLADGCGDLVTSCRARLRLFSALHNLGETGGASSLASETRRLIFRLADPQLTAWLHVRVGEVEAKRGALDESDRHFRAARELLTGSPNLVLGAFSSLGLGAVAFMRGDLETALHETDAARLDAERSGYATILVPSIANIGLTNLQLGRFEEARNYIARGLDLSVSLPQAQISLLDTSAQLCLAEGDVEGAGELFARIDALASEPTRKTWNLVNISLTRARYLLRAGRADEALRVADHGIAEVTPRSDRLMRAQFQSLCTQALIATGRTDEASRALITALTLLDDAPLGVLADAERARSKLLAELGRPAAAELGFQRTLRILRSVRDVPALREAEREREHAAALHQRAADGTDPARDAPPALRSSGTEMLTATAHLFATASRPALLGEETLALLDTLGVARAARLVHRPPRGAPRPVQSIGAAADERAWRSSKVPTVPLRRDNNGILELEVIPHESLEDHTAVVSICRLARAAARLDAAAREARLRSSLWPIEEQLADTRGIFIAPAMQEVLDAARRVAPTDLPVLLLGETGTGKEVIAREIHRLSNCSSGPFVPFNCTAVSRDMLDSQLFGYRRGAFTGAQEDFPGVIRGADGGTLFLDEIGEMTSEIQPKLLRFLESGEIHPLGRTQPVPTNVRVIAATNAPLSEFLRAGRFRQDLYYRLNVCRIIIPPLRERPEEIPALVQHFARVQSTELGKPVPALSDEVMEYFLLYDWPGNVRQLANEVRRAVSLAAPGETVTPDMLTPEILEARKTGAARAAGGHEVRVRLNQPLSHAIEQLERAMIAHALESSRGSFAAAARQLGVTRRGFLMKRRRLGIKRAGEDRWATLDETSAEAADEPTS
jgi:DNA-binding NtrC family response regulator/tetratricopeptide (TPR) repeat protein